MNRAARRNLCLAAAFGASSLLFGGLLSSYTLWVLVDARDRLLAQMIFLASMIMAVLGMFFLDAFVTVLRFGFVRAKRSAAGVIGAVIHALVRAVIAFVLLGLLLLAAVGIWDTRGDAMAWLGAAVFLALVIAGYVFLFRLEKRLKAQRALKTTLD